MRDGGAYADDTHRDEDHCDDGGEADGGINRVEENPETTDEQKNRQDSTGHLPARGGAALECSQQPCHGEHDDEDPDENRDAHRCHRRDGDGDDADDDRQDAASHHGRRGLLDVLKGVRAHEGVLLAWERCNGMFTHRVADPCR